jgi:hypothetical protein
MKIRILRNSRTGLFFDGTNFSAEDANKALRLLDHVNEAAVQSIWGANTQVIEITEAQIATLELSDECDRRAAAHRTAARAINNNSVQAQREGAATRLSRRAVALAVSVYATFPRIVRQ